jgi:hypothetical protein
VTRRPRGARITAPTFETPNIEALNALRARSGALQSTIDNPLGAPGVGGTITALNSQLVRQAQAARGQAMGRATTSGQAGFAGTMAQSGADIEGALGDARYQGQTKLVSDVIGQANQEMAGNLRDRGGIEGQLNAQQLDRARILAEVAAQNAQIDRDYWSGEQQADIEDARGRLAWEQYQQEQREYDLSRGDRNREFALTQGERNREFDLTRGERLREFDLTRRDENSRFDATQAQHERDLAEQRARDVLLAQERRQGRETEQERYEREQAERERAYRDQREDTRRPYRPLDDVYDELDIPRRRYPGSSFNQPGRRGTTSLYRGGGR